MLVPLSRYIMLVLEPVLHRCQSP